MSSGFITEAEIAEAKQRRQEEWEKVRQPDQPLEVAEEPYDNRSLYEKLKEQKDKKDYDYEEAHKLKNLIRGLDDDEADFLDVVDKAKSVAEQKQQQEEDNELREFREKVASIQERNMDNKIQADLAKPKVTKLSTRPSQKSLISGLVRKRPAAADLAATGAPPASAAATKKPCTSSSSSTASSTTTTTTSTHTADNTSPDSVSPNAAGLYCIGVLPGIGRYTESSDSEKSTDTDEDYDYSSYDWVGRKISKDNHDHSQCGGSH